MSDDVEFGNQPPSTPAAGDAGSSFLSDMLNAPLDGAGAARVDQGGQQLKALAESGGFAINEAGFQRYLKACDRFLHEYPDHLFELNVLTQAAQMGSHKYGGKVAAFNVEVANGGPQSLIPNLELMADGIKKAREALVIARANYRETEEAHSQSFAKINNGL
ncbi:hypothetical protein [Amycolatopsis sp. H20-H5]|uniref:hypothetical protein n=1 Tax=Amycolatopsis sp. H20-H5 TaxID=3046309 RepID=UPI002DB8AC4A|nr:hypothetical protein [Amycolatopsis sp. H20-H5]MEC3978580.1 hypothetical protein [Amycolatopsis sp. H20-H5]